MKTEKETQDYKCEKCNLLNTECDSTKNNGKCYCGGELIKIKNQL